MQWATLYLNKCQMPVTLRLLLLCVYLQNKWIKKKYIDFIFFFYLNQHNIVNITTINI